MWLNYDQAIVMFFVVFFFFFFTLKLSEKALKLSKFFIIEDLEAKINIHTTFKGCKLYSAEYFVMIE